MRNLIISALLLASAFQTALGEQAGDWTYSVSNNQATITGYTGAGGAVTIPTSVNGSPVVIVGNGYPPVFGWGNSSVTLITIPESVTSIGNSAFYGCTGLTTLTIPNSVTSIGNFAFYGCTGLTTLTIPNSVTSIGSHAFYECTSLTSIIIPNSVTSIGDFAFFGCTGLTSIIIPNSVTSIGGGAFEDCTGLTTLTILNGVTSIGGGAFQGCTGLTSIIIPNSVTSIGGFSFKGCTGLTSIIIPNSVTSIGDWAFQGCTSLTSIIIPNSVTSIGDNAFSGCTSLTSVTMPDRFIGQTSTIGISGQVASDYIINALANNDAFVTAVANKILAKSGNYGLSVKSELETLATKTELTSSLTQSRTDGINSVLSNPNLWTLYTTSQIQNMAVGDLVLTKNVGGTFTLNYDIEQSTDLQTWTTYAPISLPLTGLPTDKAFVRIKAKQ